MKKLNHQLLLNNLKVDNDPTKINCTFIVLDFEVSHNNAVIDKIDAMETLSPSILNKPIVAKYVKGDFPNDNSDHLEGHNVYLSTNRNGEQQLEMDTIPIGVFTSEGYILNVDGKEVLAADAILWKDRFSDACDLLLEWYSRNININTSCEILYVNHEIVDGVDKIKSPIYFSGHCILNSEKRGNAEVVLPAYESSKLLSFNELNKFNKLVAQAMQHKEEKHMPEQEVETVEVEQAEVVETPTEETTETVETVEATNEVVEETQEPSELEQLQAQYDQLKVDYEKLQEQFNTATESLTQLNSLVAELSPFKEQFEKEQFEKSLNEKLDFYSEKFSALNAKDKFDSEEVQDLIRKSVFENEEGKEAKLSLNTMLVDLVTSPTTQKETTIREVASKRKDLLPTDNSFESRYSI